MTLARDAGIWIKTERANKHIRELEPLLREFIRGNAYELVFERDWSDGAQVVKVQVNAEPDIGWGAIAGDAIHNLRSALDLMVYQLVLANGGTPTDATGFPIARDAGEYEARKARKIDGIHSDAAALIDTLKPYDGGNINLWRLHRLDITDKHHVLLPVVAAVKDFIFVLTGPDMGPTPVPLSLANPYRRIFPLENGTEIGRLIPDSTKHFKMQVNAQAIFQIAFGEPEVVEGEPILATLQELADFTEGVIKPFVSLLRT